MTCVVAVKGVGEVVMAAESAAGALGDPEMHSMTMPKVFRTGPYLVGYSGSYRLGQVLWKEMVWPEPVGTLDYDFMIKTIVRAVDDCLSNQPGSNDPVGVKNREWMFLLAHRSEVFALSYKYDVTAVDYPYLAIGGGRKVAYGALHALTALGDVGPRERAVAALDAACAFTPGLRGPYLVESTRPEGAFLGA